MATTVYGWALPIVGASPGAWGGILNTLAEAIDTDLKVVDDAVVATAVVADAAMPAAGGAFTGEVETLVVKGAVSEEGSISGAVTLDLDVANAFTATVGGAVSSLGFTNAPGGTTAVGVMIKLSNGGAFAVTWHAAIQWAGGSAPSLTVSGVDVIALVTFDGGTNWTAAAQLDVS